MGTTELLLILAIAILLFGANKIPDLAAGLGKGIRNFKKALNEPDAIDVTPKKDLPENSQASSQSKASAETPAKS